MVRLVMTYAAAVLAAGAAFADDDWKPMIDADLSQWEVWTGVPHESVDVEWEGKSADGKNGTPMGLQDPLKIYTVEQHAEYGPLLNISGVVYAGLTTKASYDKYHLKALVKWGEKKYAPRLNAPRDSGILYHCQGEHGAFWNVWKQSLEYQVQENDNGDYFKIVQVSIEAPFRETKTKGRGIYDPEAKWTELGEKLGWSVQRSENHERAGEWNEIELIVVGDRAVHLSNGKVVMALRNARHKVGEEWQPLTEGEIQIQSEGAEVTYRDLKIKVIEEMPAEYRDLFGDKE